jgi:hypothetical protein
MRRWSRHHSCGPLVHLPGGVPLAAGLAAFGHRRIEGPLSLGHPGCGGVELGLFQRGLHFAEGVLGGGEPATHFVQLPPCLAPGVCPVHHVTQRARQAGVPMSAAYAGDQPGEWSRELVSRTACTLAGPAKQTRIRVSDPSLRNGRALRVDSAGEVRAGEVRAGEVRALEVRAAEGRAA